MLVESLLEKRATIMVANPRDPVLAAWFGLAGLTEAGISVTPETALRLSTVFACVRILSESIATLPLEIYRRLSGGGHEEATNHPLWKLFKFGPNAEQTSFDWVEMMVGHLALRGNGYNRLIYPEAGPLAGMIPLHPDRVRPFRAQTGAIYFEYSPINGAQQVFDAQEVLHFSIFSDGLKGRSVIEYNREAVGLGLAAEAFGARFFQNGATLSGTFSAPGKLSDKALQNLKESLAKKHTGVSNSLRPMVLEEGLEWKQLGVDPDNAQFLETRKFQVSEIARMFRIPPHMIGDLERSTNNNIEQQALDFATYTLLPLTTRLSQRMDKDLLTETGKRSFFTGFDFSVMLKADSESRGKLASAMFNTGAYSPNDIRRLEGDNPVDGGDQRYVPLNMVPVGTDPTAGADKAARSYRGLFQAAWNRIVTAEVRGLRRALDGGDLARFGQEANELLHQIKPLMRKHLTPVVESLRESIDIKNTLKSADYIEETIRTHVAELAQQLSEAGTDEGLRTLLDDMDLNGVSDLTERESMRAVLWAAGAKR